MLQEGNSWLDRVLGAWRRSEVGRLIGGKCGKALAKLPCDISATIKIHKGYKLIFSMLWNCVQMIFGLELWMKGSNFFAGAFCIKILLGERNHEKMLSLC